MTEANPMEAFNRDLVNEYRATGGTVTGPFAGRPLLLLTTTGARSGEQRTTPLVYTTDGERLVIIASKGGAPNNPAWYHNLTANPEATVELGTERFQVRAEVAQGEERDRLFEAQAAQMPNFAEYQQKTSRRIPVVTLQRMT
jgi:deazaflavin-dependent oxidoreductase (nitroreductase family)